MARHLVGVVLVAELEAVGILGGVVAHDQAHRALGGLRGYLSEHIAVRAGRAVAFCRDLYEQLTQVAAAEPGRDGHRPRPRRVGAQLEHHRLGIPVSRNVHGHALITKQPQPRSVHDKEDIPAFRWHIEGLKPGAGGAFQDDAGEQAEWLAHRNALRALALQVTPPGGG